MFVNKWEDFKVLFNVWFRKVVIGLVCFGLFVLLSIMVLFSFWLIFVVGNVIRESLIVLIGKYFFIDFLFFFEFVFVCLLIVMVGVIILVCRDILFDEVLINVF